MIKIYKILIFVYLLTYLTIVCSFAVPVKGLYEATLPIPDQNQNSRQAILPEAIRQVLIKISGDTQVMTNGELQNATVNGMEYLQSYSYTGGESEDSPLLVHFYFNPKALQQLLEENQLPLWGKNRPLVLTWILYKPLDKGYQIVTDNSDYADINRQFEAQAKILGLPVIFPLYDLPDMQHFTLSDVVNSDFEKLLPLSQRYHSDVMMIGKIQQLSKNSYEGEWILSTAGGLENQKNFGPDMKTLILQSLDNIMTNLASRYGSRDDKGNQGINLKLTILNIHSLKDLRAISRYLKGLALVTQLTVTQVNPNSLTFTIALSGGPSDLQQAIRLNHHLQMVATTDNTGLVYQWLA